MLKRDKNTLYKTAIDAGYSPEEFTTEQSTSGTSSEFTIRFRGSELYFQVRTREQAFDKFSFKYSKMAPGYPSSDGFPIIGTVRLNDVEKGLRQWLDDHVAVFVEEQTAPDLWAQSAEQSKFLEAKWPHSTNVQFSAEEKAQIEISIRQAKRLIKEEFNPTDEQMATIVERLDYLSGALDRLNKFDWRGVLLSTIIGITTNLSLDTARGAQLLQIFKNAFSGFTHLLQ